MNSERKITPVLLAGGTGSRLWPLSREQRPKQFLHLIDPDLSLFQQTLQRINSADEFDISPPLTICAEVHRFLVAQQLAECGFENTRILLEPEGKNTAAAIAAAAIIEKEHDPLLWILPSDHVIEDVQSLYAAVLDASAMAETGRLVVFGIKPSAPETGYGYIEPGKAINRGFEVAAFHEKPDLQTAQRFFDGSQHYWNSGMLLAKASTLIKEIGQHAPSVLAFTEDALNSASNDYDFIRPEPHKFSQVPAIPFDTAVLERSNQTSMAALDAGWSDVGSFAALAEFLPCDANKNRLRGNTIVVNTKDTTCFAGQRSVALLGLEGLLVVDTPDAVLIANKNDCQQIRKIVDQLKEQGAPQVIDHKEVHRPWGKYDSLATGDRFQVKRIEVLPGEKLSIQLHHHRSEHWIVVSGTAKVTIDDNSFLLTENQSTYIPIGSKHSLENPGKLTLELIEIQSGGYLGEDDIVRFEDRYGRASG